ncbi:hypothetical protein MRB53_036969 [Persea americana]|nr:hypothetical protein MRB53_036969 [Persea americana]
MRLQKRNRCCARGRPRTPTSPGAEPNGNGRHASMGRQTDGMREARNVQVTSRGGSYLPYSKVSTLNQWKVVPFGRQSRSHQQRGDGAGSGSRRTGV